MAIPLTTGLRKLMAAEFPDAANAKGVEKIILKLSLLILDIIDGLDRLFYGVPIAKENYLKRTKIPKNPLKMGIIPILRILTSIDYCNIINYAKNYAENGGFDPEIPPLTTDPKIVKVKWDLQKAAWDCLQILNGDRNDYIYADNPDIRNKLFKAVYEVKKIILKELAKAVREPGTFYGTTGDIDALIKVYPQLNFAYNTVKRAFRFLDRYTDFRQLDGAAWQKVVKTADVIKGVCELIVGLRTPAAFLAMAISRLVPPEVYQQLLKIQELLRPERAIPFLRRIIDVLKNILKICETILAFIELIQFIIIIVIIILRVIKLIIVVFLLLLPIPNMFTTMGITNTSSKLVQDLFKLIDWIIKRLEQINLFLLMLDLLLRTIIPILKELIYLLDDLIGKLGNCDVPEDIVGDLQDLRDGIEDAVDQFYAFIKNKELNDEENGTYDPNLTPIDEVLLYYPTDTDFTGISRSVGVGNLFSGSYRFPTGSSGSGIYPSGSFTGSYSTGSYSGSLSGSGSITGSGSGSYYSITGSISITFETRLRSIVNSGRNITNPKGKIGEYTIDIVNEEVVEKTFTLRRRYGIAINARGEVVVQSTPTYASDSGIIIQEVQQLLFSKGLIKKSSSILTPSQKNIVTTTISYLYKSGFKNLNWTYFPGLGPRTRSRLGIDLNGNRIPADPRTVRTRPLSPKPGSGGSNQAGSINPGYQFDPDGVQNPDMGIPNEDALNDFFLSDNLGESPPEIGVPEEDQYEYDEFDNFVMPEIELDQYTLDDFEVDPPDNEDEDVGLGLNAFVNKLPGGKGLRRRMRKIFAKKLKKLKEDVAAEDPDNYTKDLGAITGRATDKIVQSEESGAPGYVDTTNGAHLYEGTIIGYDPVTGQSYVVGKYNLRADSDELAIEKLRDIYDPGRTHNYSYSVVWIG